MSMDITETSDGWELSCRGKPVWYKWSPMDTECIHLFPTRAQAMERYRKAEQARLKLLGFVTKHNLFGYEPGQGPHIARAAYRSLPKGLQYKHA